MEIRDLAETMEPERVGRMMFDLARDLYPICRSITGKGARDTLQRIGRLVPLETREIPTGTQVYDWTVPKEWNIRDAYIKDSSGARIVDFRELNLHVLNYSTPIHRTVTSKELSSHLFSLPEYPDWVPYKTSYYSENWGFCLAHNQRVAMREDAYEVCIDSTLEDGHLTYGEYYLPGETADEIMLSCHICHPSLCNDNLSGIALCALMAHELAQCSHRYSYRFLFIPGTIGAITWLALNEHRVSRIKHGLVVACVGDPGHMTYKKSRRGDAEIDRAVVHVLKHCGEPYDVVEFSPYGYDERQFCSPGFDLPVGSLTRTPHGRYPEYHTSADNLDFVSRAAMADSFLKYLSVLRVLERNRTYLNQNPRCEPQLGRRGLYRQMGGHAETRTLEMAMLWVLNLSDGGRTLLDIAERADLRFEIVDEAARLLSDNDLLREVT